MPGPHSRTERAPLELQCGSCGAKLAIAPDRRSDRCPFCDSPWVVDRPATRDRPDPAFVLGFAVDSGRALALVRDWIASRSIFTPAAVRRAAVEGTRGVYLPAYLYTAVADARYRAKIGEDYQEVETYTTTDGKGRTTTHTRVVTRTEWHTLAGRFRGYVRDVLVTASRGVGNSELEAVEPFDLCALRRYEPALVSGWISEEPTLTRQECRELAADEARSGIGGRIAAFLPGDHQSDVAFEAELVDESIDLVLVPVWVCAARHHPRKPPVRILVNGQTGEVAGEVPLSAWRVAAGVVLAAGFLALLAGIVLAALGVLG